MTDYTDLDMRKIVLILISALSLLYGNLTYAQLYPGGDSCEVAVPILPGYGYSTPFDGDGILDHWYSFIAPCDGELIVSNGGENEPGKRIHTGVCGSLELVAEGTWAELSASHTMLAGETVFIQINNSWDLISQFNIEYEGCAEIDSALLDISGTLYYDMNDNGVRDLGEDGRYLNFILSDPVGIFCGTNLDGFYYSPVTDLPDGVYEIYPSPFEHWGISSDSAFYTIVVDDTYEQRDSLDFGFYPDSIFHELSTELIGGYPRCNDTILYTLDIQNTGTTITSGSMHLEIDDSLYYVTANILPDSIVGQHLYWHYDDLFFGEHHQILVQLGTPDGLEDDVLSTLWTTIDSADIELFSSVTSLEQTITCAYDPNDKTPTPLGVGEFGYISPLTESIEYLIRFQNTGTDTAINVVIKDQLDANIDWNSLSILSYSHPMSVEMNAEGELSFIFNTIMLPDSNVNMIASQGFVKYRVDLLPGLPLETSIFNTANIYFDLNPAIVTNTTINTLHLDDSGLDDLSENQQLLVYPNPFSEMVTVYFGEDLKNYSIQVVDLLGNEVYVNNQVNGSQIQIQASELTKGMYILLLIDNESKEVVTNAKLMVK